MATNARIMEINILCLIIKHLVLGFNNKKMHKLIIKERIAARLCEEGSTTMLIKNEKQI